MNKIGGGILITHSQGGEPGWHTAIKTDKVRAIVSYEPGSGFVFPEGEVPEPLQTISPFGALGATSIPLADFEKLTRFPIIIYYGDYIPDKPSDNWAMDSWRVRLQWHGCLQSVSIVTVAMPRWYICQNRESRAIRISFC